MTNLPGLKGIISPTTVGIAASARAVTDANKIGKVIVTGLGTPNQMRAYVKSGAAPAFELWNPADLGYLVDLHPGRHCQRQDQGQAGRHASPPASWAATRSTPTARCCSASRPSSTSTTSISFDF